MGFILSLLFCGFSVHAELGGTIASLPQEKTQIKAEKLKLSKKSSYSVHEMSLKNKTVREFADGQGHIFAVTWQGQGHSDLPTILGAYYTAFIEAQKNQGHIPGRRNNPPALHSGNLVIERHGLPKNIWGRAYLEDQVPSGVKLEEIQ